MLVESTQLSMGRTRIASVPVARFLIALLLPLAPTSTLAVPVEWEIGSGGNGHLYEALLSPSALTWDDAAADAAAGGTGHLVSIGSAEENDFVFSLIDAPEYWILAGPQNFGPWIGGVQDPLGPEPLDGWGWVDGSAWTFFSWAAGQPDDSGGNEHYAHYFVPSNARAATWNDWVASGLLIASYVWESNLPAACGDGIQSGVEECDDGNTVAGDGCDATCLSESSFCGDGTIDPGEACDDANTVAGDGCSENCTVEIAGVCPAVRFVDCVGAGRGSLKIVEKKAGGEKLSAALKFIGPTVQSDFGDPVSGSTTVALCVYDGTSTLVLEAEVDRAGSTCGSKQKPCWKSKSTKGYGYKDPDAASGGVKKLAFTSGPAGKGKLQVKAGNKERKGQMSFPTGAAAALEGTTTATLQVLASDARCFGISLDRVQKADGVEFKAKGFTVPPG